MAYTKLTRQMTITDRAETDIAVPEGKPSDNAYYNFEHEETVVVNGEEQKTLVPFHAVDKVVTSQTASQEEGKDPYGCEESVPADALTDENGNPLTDENDNVIEAGE